MKGSKRITALLLALLLCVQLLPAVSAAEEERTVSIGTAEEFAEFAQNCTRDIWSRGLTAELTADIDLTGREDFIVPYFQGHFKGNHHTIRGIRLEDTGSKLGLFRTLTEQAVVEDLTVEGLLKANGSAASVGLLAGENRGTIRNCTVKGRVQAEERTGGVAGRNEKSGRIENTVGEVRVQGLRDTGGIAGENLGVIAGCVNRGQVNITDEHKAPINVGGIAGSSEGLVEQCRNAGEVGYPHIGYNVGGIVGLQSGEVRSCSSVSDISGRKDVGGITGQLEPEMKLFSSPSPFDSIDRNMSDFVRELERCGDQLSEMAKKGIDSGNVIHGSMDVIQDEMSGAGESFTDDLKDISDDLDTAGDDLKKVVEALRDAVQDHSDEWSDGAQNLVDNVDAQVEIIQDQLKLVLDDLNARNSTLRDISDGMTKSLDRVRDGIRQLGDTPQLTLEDESAAITEGSGVISGCTAEGKIIGDFNMGGIVGTLCTEVRDDPELNMELGDISLVADTTVKLRAVVRECSFRGAVSSRNDCAGGILGLGEAGAVVNSTAYAGVRAETGYSGGIAGRMKGSVISCAAMTDLDGSGWLGGIVGLGRDISDCIAMVRVYGDGEFCGAIAGDTDGELSDNYYLLEELAGLDGVDYAGRAQGLSFEEFSALEQVPADFLTFSYRFVADGRTVAEIPFAYGDDLDESLVPPSPVIGSSCGYWPEFPVKDLHRSLVLNAVFDEPDRTVSWGGQPARLLAEGDFTHDADLTAEEIALPAAFAEGKTPVQAYRYQVSGSRGGSIVLRLRTEGCEKPEAAVLKDDHWECIPAETDGSYLVIRDLPLEGSVLLLETKGDFPMTLLAVCGAALAAALLLLILHRTRKKKKEKQK